MKISPLYLSALAVVAIDGLNVTGIKEPIKQTEHFYYTGITDATGKNWIVKYPLNDEAGTMLEAEVGISKSLLKEIEHGKLPFDVLRPAGFTQVEHGRVMVYRAPRGQMQNFEELSEADAHELGRTLAAIHNMDNEVVTRAGMPTYNAKTIRERLQTEIDEILAVTTLPSILQKRWKQLLADDSLWNFQTSVIHGDITDENFLWNEGRITCILGFNETQIGDMAQDFAVLLTYLDADAFAYALESYRNAADKELDENFLMRARLLDELSLARWLMHGIRTENDEIITDARQMLDELAEEVLSDPDLAVEPVWQVDTDAIEELEYDLVTEDDELIVMHPDELEEITETAVTAD